MDDTAPPPESAPPATMLERIRAHLALPRRAGLGSYQEKLFGWSFGIGWIVWTALTIAGGLSWLPILLLPVVVGLVTLFAFAIVAGLLEAIGGLEGKGEILAWPLFVGGVTAYCQLKLEPPWLPLLALAYGLCAVIPVPIMVAGAWRRSRGALPLSDAALEALAKIPAELPDAVEQPLDRAATACVDLIKLSAGPAGETPGIDRAELVAGAEATLVTLARRAGLTAEWLKIAESRPESRPRAEAALARYESLADSLTDAHEAFIDYATGGQVGGGRLDEQVERLRLLTESRDELDEELLGVGA